MKVVNSQTCVQYAQEYSLKWITGASVKALDAMEVVQYEQDTILGGAKAAILEYLKDHPNAEWREIVEGPRVIRYLPALYKRQIKKWFQEQTAGNKQQEKIRQLVEKIREYQRENPQAQWPEIRRKFHIDRKSEEEQEVIKQHIGI